MTRRTILIALAGPLLAASEFHDSKPASEWSVEEKAWLTASSPWAVKTHVRTAGSEGDTPSLPRVTRSTEIPGSTSTHMGDNALPAGPTPAPVNDTGPLAFYGEVVVTWESAEPIRLARNQPLPAEFRNHYAVRVTGLPAQSLKAAETETGGLLRQLRGTVIEVSPKKREHAAYALLMQDNRSLLFAFPAKSFPLGRTDRFVSFRMNLSQMIVEARFDLRQTTYRNATAV